MLDLKRAGIVRTKRARTAATGCPVRESVTVADVIRAVEGPLANIHDLSPEETSYPGRPAPARRLDRRPRQPAAVLEQVTLAELTRGACPRRWRADRPAGACRVGDRNHDAVG